MGQALHKPTAEERLRGSRRIVSRSVREIERENNNLELQEQKLRRDLKRMVEKGDLTSAKILARDIARTAQYQAKLYDMRSQLHMISLRLQTLKSSEALALSLQDIAHTMVTINAKINSPTFRDATERFIKESGVLDLCNAHMHDSIVATDPFRATEKTCEVQADVILRQALEEVGVDSTSELKYAPQLVDPGTCGELQKIVNTTPVASVVVNNFAHQGVSDIGKVALTEDVSARTESLEERLRKLNRF